MPAKTIAAYLVEFDAALQTRLGRRRRILIEVEDHLLDAATARLKRGVTRAEAEAAAITAFGDPARVAAGFGADPLDQITTRLAVVGERLDVWMAQHPWGGAAVATSVPATIYLLAATVGVLLNGMPVYTIALSGAEPVPLMFLIWGGLARSLRGRREPGLSARATAAGREGIFKFQYQWWLGLAGLSLYRDLTRRDAWNHDLFLAFVGLAVAGGIVVWLVQATVRRWKRSGMDGDLWGNPHPWSDAVPEYSVAFAFAWLVVLAADLRSPLTVRLAIGVVVVLSASLFWFYRGSVSSLRARVAFHHALAAEERASQEWVVLTHLGITEAAGGDREGSRVGDEHDNEET